MGRVSLYNRTRAVFGLAVANRTNGSVNGSSVGINLNLANFRAAMLVVLTGGITDGTHAVTIQDSPDGTTGWANIDGTRLQGSLPSATTADANKVYEIGVNPDPARPFLRAVVTTSGATTGGAVGAVWLLGQPAQAPVTRP